MWIGCLALRLHGFSLPFWHNYIDQSVASEVLLHEPRPIRTDDWLASLPIFLGQSKTQPSFNIINNQIGSGLNSALFSVSFYKGITSVFRPWTWGVALDSDFGLSWMWCYRYFGIILTGFLFFGVMIPGKPWISVAGALILLFSSFVQYWALNNADVLMSFMLCVVGFYYVLCGTGRKVSIGAAVLLGWSGGCFLNTQYPPYQVPLAYLFLFFAVGLLILHRERISLRSLPRYVGLLAIALLVFVAAAISFYGDIHDIYDIAMHTDYPGTRFTTGGDALLRYLCGSILLRGRDGVLDAFMGNICNSGSFIFLFPALFVAQLLLIGYTRRAPSPLVIMGWLGFGGQFYYTFHGVPPLFAKLSLLSMTTTHGMLIGMGLMDLALLVLFLAEWYQARDNLSRWQRLTIYAVPVLCLGAFWTYLYVDIKALNPALVRSAYVFKVAAMMILAVTCALRWQKGLLLLAIFAIQNTFWFNPVVKGGAKYLTDNLLSRKIVEITGNLPSESVWVAYDTATTSNLFRIIGVKSLGGVVWPPQVDFWKNEFHIKEADRPKYNRYAHVVFAKSASMTPILSNPSLDTLVVDLSPESEVFDRLHVNALLTNGSTEFFDNLKEFSRVYDIANNHIYIRRKWLAYLEQHKKLTAQ